MDSGPGPRITARIADGYGGGGSGRNSGGGGGGGSGGPSPEADAIDRIREILRSTIDRMDHQTTILQSIFDRSMGPLPPSTSPNNATLDVSFENITISDWLSKLEQASNRIDTQLARVREQKV